MDERNNDVCSLDEEKDCECFQSKHMDIWSDEQTTMMLHGRQLLDDWSPSESSKTRKIILQYHQNHDQLMFKTLVIPKLEKRKQIILYLQVKIRHFGERRMLIKVNK